MSKYVLDFEWHFSCFILVIMCMAYASHGFAQRPRGHHRPQAIVSGKVLSTDKTIIDFATVYLKGTNFGCTTNEKGIYHLKAPAGTYTLVVSAIGFDAHEQKIEISEEKQNKYTVVLKPSVTELDEVVVVSNGVSRLKRSAFNAIALDAKSMQNSTLNLSEALAQAPGMKLRESGGVGSDMQLMMDGFSGNHIKVFIDGVPQEGVGSSFGLNNIPVNYAERIEVYKGVVPVGFGADAIGGVINIVTNKNKRNWFMDASYSYGSFNTHKSYVNFGQTFKNGLTYEINAFQNYSDNSYKIDATGVKHFLEGGGSQQNSELVERVKRFHDNYHNEAASGKIGFVDKAWADRLMLGITYSRSYQEIQTDARQTVAFGEKFRKGYSIMPSLEYRKRDLLTKGLDLVLTANYNRNMSNNVDTASYEFNWLGEKRYKNGSLGEVSYQDTRSYNDNWNATVTANYRIGKAHAFTFNHVLNSFHRRNETIEASNANNIAKVTRKNITGLSYRMTPSEKWNLSVFGKYYNQFNAGPVPESSGDNQNYYRNTITCSTLGYGAAGTYFLLKDIQIKLSYEKAYRLPTNEELFGNEDLEQGEFTLRPEKSDNLNLNLSYNRQFGKHSVYVEGGLVYRYTKDYIQRTTENVSGTYYGAYSNHGRVKTKGYNVSARYGYGNWVSVGGNYTEMDVRDDEEFQETGSSRPNLSYGSRMPNLPYKFANSDISFFWQNCGKKGNVLSLTYDNLYMHSFPLFSEAYGSKQNKMMIPTQFSHNLALSYSMKNGRYNLSFECRNFTDEKLYDNFNLQKAGRAFYGKVRVYLGNK